jgi:hypothetical protein
MWGFDIKQFMRIIALEGLNMGMAIPVRLWYHNGGLYDPYEILTGREERKLVSVPGLFRFLGYTGRDLNADLNDPVACAKLVRWITLRSRLYNSEG